jgi:hypothetical protein
MVLSMVFGVIYGLCTAINSLSMKYHVENIGFTPLQMTMDTNLFQGLCLLPWFFIELHSNPRFDRTTLLLGLICAVGVTTNFCLFTYSI